MPLEDPHEVRVFQKSNRAQKHKEPAMKFKSAHELCQPSRLGLNAECQTAEDVKAPDSWQMPIACCIHSCSMQTSCLQMYKMTICDEGMGAMRAALYRISQHLYEEAAGRPDTGIFVDGDAQAEGRVALLRFHQVAGQVISNLTAAHTSEPSRHMRARSCLFGLGARSVRHPASCVLMMRQHGVIRNSSRRVCMQEAACGMRSWAC